MAKLTIPALKVCPENDINAFFLYKYGCDCYLGKSETGVEKIVPGCPFNESVIEGSYMMSIHSETLNIDEGFTVNWWYSIELNKDAVRKMTLQGHLEKLALRFAKDLYCLNDNDQLVIAKVVADKEISEKIKNGIYEDIDSLYSVKFDTLPKGMFSIFDF